MLSVSCTRALVQKSYGFPKQKRKGINFIKKLSLLSVASTRALVQNIKGSQKKMQKADFFCMRSTYVKFLNLLIEALLTGN